MGEFAPVIDAETWQSAVQTRHLSTFSRSDGAQEFERFAVAELHRRGLANAQAGLTVLGAGGNAIDAAIAMSRRFVWLSLPQLASAATLSPSFGLPVTNGCMA